MPTSRRIPYSRHLTASIFLAIEIVIFCIAAALGSYFNLANISGELTTVKMLGALGAFGSLVGGGFTINYLILPPVDEARGGANDTPNEASSANTVVYDIDTVEELSTNSGGEPTNQLSELRYRSPVSPEEQEDLEEEEEEG